MAGGDLLVDRLVAGGFLRPAVLLRGLQLRRPALSCWRVGLLMGLSGLLVEPLAWLQSWLWARRLRKAELPDDPIVVIGHRRSGTTHLHQLLACDPTLAHCPQFAHHGTAGGAAAQTLDSLGTPSVDDAEAADRRGALGSE